MTLASAVQVRESAPIQNPHNILIYDLERVPGRAIVKHRGLTIEGDFWDLGSWKHTIGRRIHADDVIEWPRTICAAWRWYGENKIHFAAEWHKGGHEAFIQTVWKAMDRADVIVGHNIVGFDNRKMLSDFMVYGIPRTSSFKAYDTLREARRAGFESNTLDALCKRLGITAKSGAYSVATARAAVAGNAEARRELKSYNMGDIDASTAIYDRLRPYSSAHPHSVVGDGHALDRVSCHACWGHDLAPNGVRLAQQILYREYRCNDCGAINQGTAHSRAAITRGVPA